MSLAFLLMLAAQTLLQVTPVFGSSARVASPASAPNPAPSVTAEVPASVSVSLDNGRALEGPPAYFGFNASAGHPNPQNLTTAGPTDWRIWGVTSTDLAGDERKAGGTGISNLVNINPPDPIGLRALGNLGLDVGIGASTIPFSYEWADGANGASEAPQHAGLQHDAPAAGSVGKGFSFTVPASTASHRLMVWVSAHHGTGKLTATLGGLVQVDSGVSGGQNFGGVYTIDYLGDGTPGQTMNVSYVLDSAVTPTSTPDEVGLPSTDANVVVYAAALSGPPPVVEVAAPVLYQATDGGEGDTRVAGRLTAAPSTSYEITVRSAGSCVEGSLPSEVSSEGTFTTTTDATGNSYFSEQVTGGSPDRFVTAQVTGPGAAHSDPSPCISGGPDNDTWPRALLVSPGSVNGVIDDVGRARWFKIAIQPGSKVHVNLTGLPADYDLFVFKDIGQAFVDLNSTSDLTRLSAEFAPSAFSPSAFSPSAFSPSAFSPSAFSPSAFSPSAFSPSAFSPSAFSPSAFSPSAFSPSAFSPSAFSPSAFSPSAFSPSAFSAETYASAQIRSLITGSVASGTANEAVVADTWNNTGYYYMRVSGKNGAFDLDSDFTLSVTRDASVCDGVTPEAPDGFTAPAGPSGGYKTLILTDFSRMPSALAGNSTADKAALTAKLTTFKGRAEIGGAVEDLGSAAHARIQTLNGRADTHTSCMYAKNLVAEAIRDVVAAYRLTNPNLKYVVLVGGDGAIPFFRYPDQSLLGPEQDYVAPVLQGTASDASLKSNYVLGQDAYGATVNLSLHASLFPVPDLPVGRLVETATEASGLLDAYNATANGTVASSSALVTGYDFLEDAANSVTGDLTASMGTSATVDKLIAKSTIAPGQPCDSTHLLPNCSWNATALRNSFANTRHDLVFLAGHFSSNNALAADFTTTLASTDLSVPMTNSIVFSAGCHSGYNVVDPDAVAGGSVDWAQALTRRGATLIGGTGYQYGDTDFLEYSERIYAEFAHQLRIGTGSVSIGQALMRSKQIYLATTPDIRGIHEKALLESTIFGLPMLSVNLPTGRIPAPTPGSIVSSTTPFATNPGSTLGLSSADKTITSTLTPHPVPMTNLAGGTTTATYYSGSSGVVTNPDEPAVPLESRNVSVAGKVLRGVGFRGGSYTDETVIPLTGAPADPDKQIRGIHRGFGSPVFFPMRLSTLNYFDALSGGTTNLLVTPAQHRTTGAADGSAILRKYANLDLRFYYSAYTGNAAASGAPTITGVNAVVAGGNVTISAHAFGDPQAGIQQVWVTYTGHANAWTSVDLVQDAADSTLWSKTFALPTALSGRSIDFLVQAVNGVGLVSLDDNAGKTYSVNGLSGQTVTIVAPATKTLGDPDFAVSAASSAGLPVTLTGTSPSVCTLSSGMVHILAIGSCTLSATQAGDATHIPASATATIKIIWPFTGFFQPVDNPGTAGVLNTVNAGSAVPIKFSLGGNRGLGILAANSPIVTTLTCPNAAPVDEIETLAGSTSGLQYDATSNQYNFTWKTVKGQTGCRSVNMKLIDGTDHIALFKFK